MIFPDDVASEDLYGLLGVAKQASGMEIRTGWLSQVRRWHPDRNPHPLATARTQAINGAYGILSDATLRAQYDRHGFHRSSRPPEPWSPDGRRQAAEARWAAHEAEWRAREAEWAAEAERSRRLLVIYWAEEQMYAAFRVDSLGRRDLLGALRLAVEAVEMLPEYAPEILESVAGHSPDFDILSPGFLRCVWTGLLLAPVLQNQAALTRITSILDDTEVLKPWRPLLGPAKKSFQDVGTILRYVRNNPGAIQSKLCKELGLPQSDVREKCYFLAAAGSIRREKAGSSYAMFPNPAPVCTSTSASRGSRPKCDGGHGNSDGSSH